MGCQFQKHLTVTAAPPQSGTGPSACWPLCKPRAVGCGQWSLGQTRAEPRCVSHDLSVAETLVGLEGVESGQQVEDRAWGFGTFPGRVDFTQTLVAVPRSSSSKSCDGERSDRHTGPEEMGDAQGDEHGGQGALAPPAGSPRPGMLLVCWS